MNDRYLYKAKRLDNEEWVIGSLVYSEDTDEEFRAIIIPTKESCMYIDRKEEDLGFENWYKVDASTICQCTSLKDKNGNLIWENDVVEIDFEYFQIHWDEDIARYMLVQNDKTICDFIDDNSSDVMKIVGSIIDNPELLEVER